MKEFRVLSRGKIISFSVFKGFYFEDKISFNSNGNRSKISDTVISNCVKTLKKYANFRGRPHSASITKRHDLPGHPDILYCKVIDQDNHL